MKKKRRILWKKIFLFITFFAVIIGLFYICFRTNTFTITSYQLVGIPKENEETILKELDAISQKPLYRIFPSNRTFLYNAKEIRKFIATTLPTTEHVKFMPISPHKLRISITVYKPLFKASDTHAVTVGGIIYKESQDISKLPLLEIASSTIERKEKRGIVIESLDQNAVAMLPRLSLLVPKINSILFPVSFITIDSFRDVKLFDQRKKSYVIFSLDADIQKVWSNIVSAIDTDPLKSKLEKDKSGLLYLDSRFGNKVFYKFTNDTTTAIIPSYVATSTATTTLSE